MKAISLLLVFLLACKKEPDRCTLAGGHWEEYDCRTVMIPYTTIGPNGYAQINYIWTNSCKERCVGASAEMPSK